MAFFLTRIFFARTSKQRFPLVRPERPGMGMPAKSMLAAALLMAVPVPQLHAQILSVGANVNINRQSGYQAEEAIAIDPTNPNRMFAWSNDLNSRNSAAYTVNGGLSWTSRFTGSDGWPALGGDPTCTFDNFGNLFGASFNSTFGSILVRGSVNAGQTFPSSLATWISLRSRPGRERSLANRRFG